MNYAELLRTSNNMTQINFLFREGPYTTTVNKPEDRLVVEGTRLCEDSPSLKKLGQTPVWPFFVAVGASLAREFASSSKSACKYTSPIREQDSFMPSGALTFLYRHNRRYRFPAPQFWTAGGGPAAGAPISTWPGSRWSGSRGLQYH